MSPFWMILKLRMMELVVTTGTIRYAKLVITNKPTHNFLQAGCPSCCLTNIVEALNGKGIFHGLAHPKLTCGSSNSVVVHYR